LIYYFKCFDDLCCIYWSIFGQFNICMSPGIVSVFPGVVSDWSGGISEGRRGDWEVPGGVSEARRMISEARRVISGTRRVISGTRRVISEARRVVSEARRVVSGERREGFGGFLEVLGRMRGEKAHLILENGSRCAEYFFVMLMMLMGYNYCLWNRCRMENATDEQIIRKQGRQFPVY